MAFVRTMSGVATLCLVAGDESSGPARLAGVVDFRVRLGDGPYLPPGLESMSLSFVPGDATPVCTKTAAFGLPIELVDDPELSVIVVSDNDTSGVEE